MKSRWEGLVLMLMRAGTWFGYVVVVAVGVMVVAVLGVMSFVFYFD